MKSDNKNPLPGVEQLIHEALEWKSNQEFYKTELHFFEKLCFMFLTPLTKQEGLVHVNNLVMHIQGLIKTNEFLSTRIEKHLIHLEDALENKILNEHHVYTTEHSIINKEIKQLTSESNEIKSELYEITEKLLHHEKLKHLLTE